MSLDTELRELFERTEDAPWPGEDTAYDRFLRRRARRGRRAVAAVAGLAMVAVLAGAVLVPRLRSPAPVTAAPTGGKLRVESQGFELKLPAGWVVERELLADRPGDRGGAPRPTVVGVVLRPASPAPDGAEIRVEADENPKLDYSPIQGGKRRADGIEYRLHPGVGRDGVGRYAMFWPDFCTPRIGCQRSAWPRILWVSGRATGGGEQVEAAMRKIVLTVRRITDAVLPPPPPTVPAKTRVRLGEGGSGMTAWELRIEPLDGSGSGLSVHFPWLERRTADQGWHWESLEPWHIQRDGTSTLMDCYSWVPGSGLLLTGLARQDVASVRFELEGRPPVTVTTFGRSGRIPWVAYASPRLPAGSRVERVVALDATGKVVGGQEWPYDREALCRPR